jgi:hypothetical protein
MKSPICCALVTRRSCTELESNFDVASENSKRERLGVNAVPDVSEPPNARTYTRCALALMHKYDERNAYIIYVGT